MALLNTGIDVPQGMVPSSNRSSYPSTSDASGTQTQQGGHSHPAWGAHFLSLSLGQAEMMALPCTG